MQPSSPTMTAELGSPSAVKAYRSVPISEKVIFFSAMSVVDAKPLAINLIPYALALSPSLRANGSRERAPDDRLREAIHCHLACGGMDCFAALAMTTCAYFFTIAAVVVAAGWHRASAAWRARRPH